VENLVGIIAGIFKNPLVNSSLGQRRASRRKWIDEFRIISQETSEMDQLVHASLNYPTLRRDGMARISFRFSVSLSLSLSLSRR